MPAQVVGGVTVGLAFAPVEESVEEIGDRARAFNGTMRSTVRTFKRSWTQQTKPISDADATTLLAALRGALPVAVSGDVTGAVNTHPKVNSVTTIPISGGTLRRAVNYTLFEV